MKGDKPSINYAVINPFIENLSVHNIGKEDVQYTSEEDFSSSLNSLQKELEKFYSYIHIIFPIVESILQDLFVKGEEI